MNAMNINNFDTIFVGLSGGKDSTALALWVRFESGWPLDKIIFGFMDTENEDNLTYEFLRYLSSVIYPCKVQRYDPGIGFYSLCRKKKRFPGAKSRFCTEELKIKPKHRMFAAMIEDGLAPLNCTGVRTAEAHSGNNRGSATYWDTDIFTLTATERTELLLGINRKDPEFIEWCYSNVSYFSRKSYIVDVCRPIVDWSLDDVWRIHQRYLSLDAIVEIVEAEPDDELMRRDEIINKIRTTGIPRNPLYETGATRVGCFPCINSRKLEIRGMSIYRPDRINFLRQAEQWVGENRDGANISTFFPKDKTPRRFASKRIVAADGTVHFVPTIDDVVRWSWTADNAAEMEQLSMFSDDAPSACSVGGHCE